MKKKRIFGILLSLALMVGMMPVLGLSQTAYADDELTVPAATEYPLWVGGEKVTSANANDILGDQTASYDADNNKLTLNNANITTGYSVWGDVYGIYYDGDIQKDKDVLLIESPSDSNNKIIRSDGMFYEGIRAARGADIAFSGNGKLTVVGSGKGIYANCITIDGTDVNATSNMEAAINASTDVVIKNGKVTVSGEGDGIYSSEGNINISDSTVTSETNDDGIIANKGDINISDSTVSSESIYDGICADEGAINISNSNVTATGKYSGINASKNVTINGGTVIAAGDSFGIKGTVKNNIGGTGWTDKAGTAGKAAIAINTEGQDLTKYKKVQFPAKADPTPAPTPTPVVTSVAVNSKTVSAKTLKAAITKAGGNPDSVTTIVLGKKVKKISKGAFKSFKSTKTLVVQSKKLTKKSVKGSLKGSNVKTVKVKVGKKKVNKKYVKKYKKIFTKKNAGRKVRVRS